MIPILQFFALAAVTGALVALALCWKRAKRQTCGTITVDIEADTTQAQANLQALKQEIALIDSQLAKVEERQQRVAARRVSRGPNFNPPPHQSKPPAPVKPAKITANRKR